MEEKEVLINLKELIEETELYFKNDDGWISTVAPCYPTGLSSSQQDEFLQFVKNKMEYPLRFINRFITDSYIYVSRIL